MRTATGRGARGDAGAGGPDAGAAFKAVPTARERTASHHAASLQPGAEASAKNSIFVDIYSTSAHLDAGSIRSDVQLASTTIGSRNHSVTSRQRSGLALLLGLLEQPLGQHKLH